MKIYLVVNKNCALFKINKNKESKKTWANIFKYIQKLQMN